MKQQVPIGQTDYTVLVKIRDEDGAPVTGLDETDIDIAYARVETDNDVVSTNVTPAALAGLTAAHTDWGFEEVSAVDHPGLYRLDLGDAVFAAGAWSAVVTVFGTGLDPADLEFVLVDAPNNLSAAQVLAQVNAAIDTAISELGVAAPAATPTLRTALMLLYMMARNKVTVTNSAKALHNDAGTQIAAKALTDDGTTYTEAEMA